MVWAEGCEQGCPGVPQDLAHPHPARAAHACAPGAQGQGDELQGGHACLQAAEDPEQPTPEGLGVCNLCSRGSLRIPQGTRGCWEGWR